MCSDSLYLTKEKQQHEFNTIAYYLFNTIDSLEDYTFVKSKHSTSSEVDSFIKSCELYDDDFISNKIHYCDDSSLYKWIYNFPSKRVQCNLSIIRISKKLLIAAKSAHDKKFYAYPELFWPAVVIMNDMTMTTMR